MLLVLHVFTSVVFHIFGPNFHLVNDRGVYHGPLTTGGSPGGRKFDIEGIIGVVKGLVSDTNLEDMHRILDSGCPV